MYIIKRSYTSWLAYKEKNKFEIEKKYQNTNLVCKIHRKQVAENNYKKLIIILQYKKEFQKFNHFDNCIKIYRIFNFTRITIVKKWWRQQ